jgi:ribokinase
VDYGGVDKHTVTVVGSLNADLTLLVERLPGRGETVLTSGPAQLSFGGKGANQAAAAAAFGGNVTMIGKVGDDDTARQIRADLSGRGIDVTHVPTGRGLRTGSAVIAVEPSGENLIIVDPGANGQLQPDDVNIVAVRQADVLLVQLEIPLETAVWVIEAATSRVVLNPAPAAPLPPPVLDRVSVLVANQTELAVLTGVPPPNGVGAIASLARQLRRDTIVTLGADGALAAPASAPAVHIPAPRAEVRDATGAGDCFCGALAVLLAEGVTLTEAARVAVAAATLSATALGARGRLPSREEATALAAGLRPSVVRE